MKSLCDYEELNIETLEGNYLWVGVILPFTGKEFRSIKNTYNISHAQIRFLLFNKSSK